MHYIIIPVNDLYEMVEYYGPHLKYNLSRMSFDLYKLKYKDKIFTEQIRMELFCKHFGYAVPSKEAINDLKKYIGKNKILEISSNLGLWSYLLLQEGIDIKPTDHIIKNTGFPFMPIEDIDPLSAFKKYKDRNILFFIVSVHNDNYGIFHRYFEFFKGDILILISEKEMANLIIQELTGGKKKLIKRFKDTTKSNQWLSVNEIEIPQWLNIDYKIYILEKLVV